MMGKTRASLNAVMKNTHITMITCHASAFLIHWILRKLFSKFFAQMTWQLKKSELHGSKYYQKKAAKKKNDPVFENITELRSV